MSTLAYPDPVSQSVSNLVTDRHKSWLDEVRWWSRRPCDLTTHSWRGPCRRAISSATSVISCVTCAPIWLDAVCAVMTTPLTSRRSCRPRHSKTIQLTVLVGTSGQVRRRAVLARRHTDMVGCGVVRDGCADGACGLRHGRQAAGARR
jgi:hypothetical protein